jgi:GntR family transcriptional regulator
MAKRRTAQLKALLDRNSPVPYYIQLKLALEAQIESGAWQAGDRIPGEAELCELFGVSRTVVRQGLKEMEFEGRIIRQKGRGTFIAQPVITSKSLVHSLIGFHQDMSDRGFALESEVLEQGIVPASDKEAGYLQVEPMTPLTKVLRLRFVENEPIVLVTSFLPYEICRELVNADLAGESLYAFLDEQCGLRVARGSRRISAVSANEFEAEKLQIEKGSPLIKLESISFTKDGAPLEYFDALFRGDRSRFEVEVKRSGPIRRDEEQWPF